MGNSRFPTSASHIAAKFKSCWVPHENIRLSPNTAHSHFHEWRYYAISPSPPSTVRPDPLRISMTPMTCLIYMRSQNVPPPRRILLSCCSIICKLSNLGFYFDSCAAKCRGRQMGGEHISVLLSTRYSVLGTYAEIRRERKVARKLQAKLTIADLPLAFIQISRIFVNWLCGADMFRWLYTQRSERSETRENGLRELKITYLPRLKINTTCSGVGQNIYSCRGFTWFPPAPGKVESRVKHLNCTWTIQVESDPTSEQMSRLRICISRWKSRSSLSFKGYY